MTRTKTATAKRIKNVDASSPIKQKENDSIFSYYRALGKVSIDVPSTLNYRGNKGFVTSAVGSHFHIYDLETLNLCFVSNNGGSGGSAVEQTSKITLLASFNDMTVTSTICNDINLYQRASLKCTLPTFPNRILKILFVSEDVLLVLSENCLYIVEISNSCTSLALKDEIKLSKTSTDICHPITYLNKVLISFDDGSMQLWNIRRKAMVFAFNDGVTGCNFSPIPVISLLAHPIIVDVVAVALSDATVHLCDIRKNVILSSFKHPGEQISSLSFRTDLTPSSTEKDCLAVALFNGQIVFWQLEGKKLLNILDGAHIPKHMIKLHFAKNQPILLSNSSDNSIKEFVLEGEDVRFLKGRSGHSEPIKFIQFYGRDVDGQGDSILSGGGKDKEIRVSSLIKDSQSTLLSQGSGLIKSSKKIGTSTTSLLLPPPTSISIHERIGGDLRWDSMLTSHVGKNFAQTWRPDHRRIGSHKLSSKDATAIVSTAISPCGNWALLGSSGGNIDVYNMQSGNFKKSIKITSNNTESILFIGMDPCTRYIYCLTTSSLSSVSFLKGGQNWKIDLDFEPTKWAENREKELLAISFSSEIQLIDLGVGSNGGNEDGKVVRRFTTPTPATSLDISSNGKWIIACHSNNLITTWDIQTSLLLDEMYLPSKPISCALSPGLDLLAVVLEDDSSIHLFVNRSLYRPEVSTTKLPSIFSSANVNNIDDINSQMISLSIEPRSKWEGLFNLDKISTSKPFIPLKEKENTPFFLDAIATTTTSTGNTKRAIDDSVVGDDLNSNNNTFMDSEDEFFTILENGSTPVIPILKKKSVNEIDFIIRTIPLDLLKNLLSEISSVLSLSKDWEICQTFLNSILKTHREFCCTNLDILEIIKDIEHCTSISWSRLEECFHSTLFITTFCKDQ